MPIGALDIITGLLSSAAYDALKAPIKRTKLYNERRAAVVRSIDGEVDPGTARDNALLEKATQDLVNVMGAEKGYFTENVDDFIKELRRTSILKDMTSLLIKKGSCDDIFPQFNFVYSTFNDLPFSSESCFSAINTALRYRIKQSTNDPELADLLLEQQSENLAHVKALGVGIAELLSVSTLRHDAIDGMRVRLAKSIETIHREIPIETHRGLRRTAINQVVIPPRLTRDPPDVLPTGSSNKSPTLPLAQVCQTYPAIVVLGDPGGGKSTLVQNICFEMSRAISLSASYDVPKFFSKSQLSLPLKVILRTYEKRILNDPSYNIFKYLSDEIAVNLDENVKICEELCRYLLTTGSAVVLFDGLDEILNVSIRRNIVQSIEQFSSNYPLCPSITTSRIVGYQDAPLNDNYQAFYLSRFSEEEVEKYATKLIKVVSGDGLDAAKISAAVFMKQTRSSAADLRVNPLLLGLMIHLYLERGDVPDSRPEIYRACANLLFNKWDQKRDIIFDHPDDFELLDLFGYLARNIFGNPDTEDGVSDQWLFSRIRDFFMSWYADKPKATAAAKSLVEFITGRAWVMCDIGPGVYKFTHRTFLEYFVALQIYNEADGITDLIREIYPKIIAAEWDVVTHLALQISTGSGPQALKAASELIKLLVGEQRQDNEEINILVFLARSTEYLSLPEPVYTSFVKSILAGITESGYKSQPVGLNIFDILITNSRKKNSLLSTILDDHVKALERSAEAEKHSYGLLLLGQGQGPASSFNPIAAHGPFGERGGKLSWYALAPARRQLQTKILGEALRSPGEATKYCLIYGDNLDLLTDRHGFGFLVNTDSEWRQVALMPPLFMILEAATNDAAARLEGHEGSDELQDTVLKFISPIVNGERISLNVNVDPVDKLTLVFQLARVIDFFEYYMIRKRIGKDRKRKIGRFVVNCLALSCVIREMYGFSEDDMKKSAYRSSISLKVALSADISGLDWQSAQLLDNLRNWQLGVGPLVKIVA